MIDTVLHIALGLVIGGLAWLAFQAGPFAGAGLVGAFAVYLREVTQRQYGKGLSFTRGWLPWKWISGDGTVNVQKVVEAVVPAVVLVTGGFALEAVLP